MLRKITFLFLVFGIVFMSACNTEKKQSDAEKEKSGEKQAPAKVELRNPDNQPIVNKFLTFDEQCDATKLNVRLVMNYNKEEKAFKGYLENTTDSMIKNVSVVIYISNKTQIGPLSAIDLYPNEKMELTFAATYSASEKWLPDLLFGQ